MQETLPGFYDLRLEGKVTPVRDQGNAGTCWSFASYGSLESFLLPGEMRDFSENNMKNLLTRAYPEGFDYVQDDGGNEKMATAYLARRTGPVNEEDDPYNTESDVSPTDLPPEKHVQNVLFLPALTGPEDAAVLKQAVMEYGAVFTAMCWNTSAYNSMTSSYYYNGTQALNHAVNVVGWNDTYDRYLFKATPPEDGAWIIRNSWATDWGDGGYFYLSYCSSQMGKMNTVFTAEDTDNYDTIYQHDPLGWIGVYGFGSETGWFSGVFTADTDEDLRAVSFYAAQYDSPYELSIYLDPAEGPINASGPVATKTGTIDISGYRTIPLDSPVALSAGQTFSVVTKLTTPGYQFPIPIEYPRANYSSKATAEAGEGYIRNSTGTWTDMTNKIENASTCLKAFTKIRYSPPTIAGITPDYGYLNRTIAITNLSGTGFRDGTMVRLTRIGQTDIPGADVSVLSGTQIACTFNLIGAVPGAWNVTVKNTDEANAMLTNGFTVCPKGDLNHNGEVDIGDVAMAAYMVVGKEPQDLEADFNGNGRVDIGDASKIAYFFVRLIPEL